MNKQMIDLPVLLLIAATESGRKMTLEEVQFFEQVYSDYAGSIQKRIRAAVSGNSDAEDLAQHCLLKLAEHVGTLMQLEPYQLAKYISVTIDNTLCSYWKKNSTVRVESIEEMENQLADNRTQYQPDFMLDLQEEVRQFAAAFELLSTKEKMLMQYRYIDALGMEEIAHRMGTKPSGVRQALYRVRKRMLEMMRKGEK